MAVEVEDIDTEGQSDSTALAAHSSKESGASMVLRLTPEVLAAIYKEFSMCAVDALPVHKKPREQARATPPSSPRREEGRRSSKGSGKREALALSECDYAKVTLHIYDTSWLASVTGVPAFHAGIEVLGTEFSFGDMGINVNKPGEYDSERYRKAVPLGYTDLRAQEVLKVLRELQMEWPGEVYRLNGHNCQTFAEVFSERLGLSNTIPEEFIVFGRPWSVSVSAWGAAELKREPWWRGRPRSNKLSL